MGKVLVRTTRLTKTFGHHIAVDSVSLEIRAGDILGFLGPNGAGKTTTINMLLGLLQPTSGCIELFGEKAAWTKSQLRKGIGTLLDDVQFYPYLSAKKNLTVFSKVFGKIPNPRIDEVLNIVGLSSRGDDKVRDFSHGMKKRLGLALSLLPDTDILILDEPTNGLDPKGIKALHNLLKRLAKAGKGIFLSSHLLREVEIICDRIIILRKGRIAAEGSVNELLQKTSSGKFTHKTPHYCRNLEEVFFDVLKEAK
ncbi:MAG: ATP-binding cassette domain-containing protein [Firmicutes bacterium]|nr:ATP-binding cassette domain-containing protein [Bacillota bacterium]